MAAVRFEVWSEGYAATGDRGTATFHGEFEAETFAQACVLAMEAIDRRHPGEGMRLFNPERLTYWMCRLYPTEAEARRTFG